MANKSKKKKAKARRERAHKETASPRVTSKEAESNETTRAENLKSPPMPKKKVTSPMHPLPLLKLEQLESHRTLGIVLIVFWMGGLASSLAFAALGLGILNLLLLAVRPELRKHRWLGLVTSSLLGVGCFMVLKTDPDPDSSLWGVLLVAYIYLLGVTGSTLRRLAALLPFSMGITPLRASTYSLGIACSIFSLALLAILTGYALMFLLEPLGLEDIKVNLPLPQAP